MATKEEILDAISGMTVLELSELLSAFEERFGVTAAAPVAVAGGAPAPPGGGGGAPPARKRVPKEAAEKPGPQLGGAGPRVGVKCPAGDPPPPSPRLEGDDGGGG